MAMPIHSTNNIFTVLTWHLLGKHQVNK